MSAVGGPRPWSHGLASSALTTVIVVVDVGLSRIAWGHGAGVGWLAYALLVAVAVVFALGTLYTWRAGQPMPLPVLCVSGIVLMALVADVLSLAVAGRGTGTSAVHAASAGTTLTLLTAAGVSVARYLLALRHLSGPALLHTAETGGRGPAVVFVHGLGASGCYWDAVVPRLAGRRTVTVDLLGFGRSPKPRRASYDVDCHTDALAPHVPGGSIVVAHSVGASVALRLATYHPARVAGLVLIAPPAHANAEAARDQISELGTLARLTARDRLAAMTMCGLMGMLRPFAAAVAPLIRRDLPSHVAMDGVLHPSPPYSRTLQRVVIDHRIDDDLAMLEVPLRVLAGSEDPVAPAPDIRDALGRSGAGPEALRVIEGGGHHPTLQEPGLVTAAMEIVATAGAGPSR